MTAGRINQAIILAQTVVTDSESLLESQKLALYFCPRDGFNNFLRFTTTIDFLTKFLGFKGMGS